MRQDESAQEKEQIDGEIGVSEDVTEEGNSRLRQEKYVKGASCRTPSAR
jgi:hypothetical protein